MNIRNVKVSPLFEKGKLYNIDQLSSNYEKEDVEGTLRPENNHCWLTWEEQKIDDVGVKHWSKEAKSFPSIKEAEEFKLTLLKEETIK